MEEFLVALLECEANVYRTKQHIVIQDIVLQSCEEKQYPMIMSFDTYITRTLERDAAYEFAFSNRDHPNGRRLPSSAYVRTYID